MLNSRTWTLVKCTLDLCPVYNRLFLIQQLVILVRTLHPKTFIWLLFGLRSTQGTLNIYPQRNIYLECVLKHDFLNPAVSTYSGRCSSRFQTSNHAHSSTNMTKMTLGLFTLLSRFWSKAWFVDLKLCIFLKTIERPLPDCFSVIVALRDL